MNHSRERGRNRRAFRLEGLEDRKLLTVFQPLPTPAEIHLRQRAPGPGNPVSFIRGRATGTQASDGLYGATNPGFVSYSGHGGARPFGEVLFGTKFLPVGIPSSTGVQVLARGTAVLNTLKGGNQLWVYFDGTSSTLNTRTGTLDLKGVVNSGTGRFLGAKGTFVGSGIVKGGRFALNYSFNLTSPV